MLLLRLVRLPWQGNAVRQERLQGLQILQVIALINLQQLFIPIIDLQINKLSITP